MSDFGVEGSLPAGLGRTGHFGMGQLTNEGLVRMVGAAELAETVTLTGSAGHLLLSLLGCYGDGAKET